MNVKRKIGFTEERETEGRRKTEGKTVEGSGRI